MSNSYPRHAAALAYAEHELAAGVHEQPAGSNTGDRVRFYQAHTWLAGSGWAWCAAFFLTCAKEGGRFSFPEASAGAWDLLERARRRGLALAPADYRRAIAGDGVVFNIGAGHIAVLKTLELHAGVWHVRTIDGNVSDRVSECLRPLAQVRGFVHWPETPFTPVPSKAKTSAPTVQVVGGIDGKRQAVHGKTGVKVPLPRKRVDVVVDGQLRNRRQLPTNPALLKRLAGLIRTARTVTVRRSR